MKCGCVDPSSPEHAYMPSHWALGKQDPDEVIKNHVETATKATIEAREKAPCRLSIPYGTGPRQKLDIYGESALAEDVPVFVYIHGGYWQALSKDESGYPVLPLLQNEIITVVVDYTLAPEATMEQMVSEMGQAGKFILDWASERGSRSITLAGHSAGAHLAAMMLVSEEVRLHPQKKQIKNAFLISGLYDLVPLLSTSVNDPLKMTEEQAVSNSPLYKTELLKSTWGEQGVEFRIVVAEKDPPKFHSEQSVPFYQKLLELGLRTRLTVVPGSDHFTVVDRLLSPDYQLLKDIVQQIKMTA